MAWDKSRPAGTTNVNVSDNNLRENNDALEAAIDLEHLFATGGTQTGRHRFAPDDNAARSVAFPSPVEGNIYINDGSDDALGLPYMQVYTSGAWESLASGEGTVPNTTRNQTWTATQSVGYENASIVAGIVTWNTISTNAFKVALNQNATMLNPTGLTADVTSTWLFEITQDATGGRTLAFQSNWEPVYGGQPDINAGANEVSYIIAYATSGQKLKYVVHL